MRWIDQQYEPYMVAQIHWGPLDIVFEKDENGKLVNLPLPEGTSAGEFRQKWLRAQADLASLRSKIWEK